jgi:hypothetical protein
MNGIILHDLKIETPTGVTKSSLPGAKKSSFAPKGSLDIAKKLHSIVQKRLRPL